MSAKIFAGTVVGLVVGLVVGVFVGLFVLPGIARDGGMNGGVADSEYTRITVFSDSAAHDEFGDYTYYFYYKSDSYYVERQNIPEDIVVSVYGNYEGLPSIAGRSYKVLDLHVVVSEVYEDYVVLLVKQAE